MLSKLSFLISIWILTPIAIITCTLRCLADIISSNADGRLRGRGLSTLSKVCALAGLILSIASSILLSISASKYLKVSQIVESNNFPSEFGSLVEYVLRYQVIITMLLFCCLWLVKASIVFDCRGFTEEENLSSAWAAYLVFLVITLILCLFLQPVSNVVCLAGMPCVGLLTHFLLTGFRLSKP